MKHLPHLNLVRLSATQSHSLNLLLIEAFQNFFQCFFFVFHLLENWKICILCTFANFLKELAIDRFKLGRNAFST